MNEMWLKVAEDDWRDSLTHSQVSHQHSFQPRAAWRQVSMAYSTPEETLRSGQHLFNGVMASNRGVPQCAGMSAAPGLPI